MTIRQAFEKIRRIREFFSHDGTVYEPRFWHFCTECGNASINAEWDLYLDALGKPIFQCPECGEEMDVETYQKYNLSNISNDE